MLKVAILSVGDYRHITLISKYTSYFDENGIEYDVICTDRYADSTKREHVYQFSFPTVLNKSKKLKSFLHFRKWAITHILQYNYDFLVVWNENTALLFSDFLIRKYKGKYCINIRDVDFLNQRFRNFIRGKVINNSSFSTYCSTAPLDFPKGYKYVLMRSMNLDILKDVHKRTRFNYSNEPIRIGFLGKVRFPEANEEIIRAFGNDERYEIYFIGAGSESLNEYLVKYNNLYLKGAYKPEETASYLENIDVINSYFGTKVLGYERMSSIRFSYAPYMHVPVLVGTKTNMEEEGTKYGFAYGFGKCPLESEADAFYNWYHSMDVQAFINGCEQYCNDINKSDLIFYSELEKALKG